MYRFRYKYGSVDLAGALHFRFGPRIKTAFYRHGVSREGADRRGRGCLVAERAPGQLRPTSGATWGSPGHIPGT